MIFAVGPVQEFIASARRSRDLWFGSWLLSEISKAAAYCVVCEEGGNLNSLVFPKPESIRDLDGTNADFAVVNKVVAVVSKDPNEIGAAVHKSMRDRLRMIREEAYRPLVPHRHFLKSIAEQQVDDLVEFFWASAPISDLHDAADYVAARRTAESLLAARKSTRDFKPVSPQPGGWAANVPKSSLDGLRESAIHEDAYKLNPAELRVQYGVRKGERLCGVGLLKRHGNRAGDDSFFSTSHVAALPLLQTVTDGNAVGKYIGELETLLRNVAQPERRKILGKVPAKAAKEAHPAFKRYDGQLLFAERLGELFEGEALEQAKRSLQSFLEVATGGKRPSPYYALLLADGDRMGEAIDAQHSINDHAALSKALTVFADAVRTIVEEDHQGSLIYAGGDDILAFVPLHRTISCARHLAKEFHEQLRDFKIEERPAANKTSPTLSVGIAVTHHLEPLSDALRLAREAEATAKSVPGKNALAVILSKRSGGDTTVKGQWGTMDERLDQFVALHRADAIPDGAGYELRDLTVRLRGVQRDAITAEAIRILKRKRAARGQEQVQEKVLAHLISMAENRDLPIERFADEMIVARLFSDASAQAGVVIRDLDGVLGCEDPQQ